MEVTFEIKDQNLGHLWTCCIHLDTKLECYLSTDKLSCSKSTGESWLRSIDADSFQGSLC